MLTLNSKWYFTLPIDWAEEDTKGKDYRHGYLESHGYVYTF